MPGRVVDAGRAQCGGADGRDAARIGVEVALGIERGQRRLAQHVVGVAIGAVLGAAGALQRFLDRAAHDELAPEHAHGVAQRLAHDRFAGPCHEAAHVARQIVQRAGVQPQDAAGEHQSPGRGVDEQRGAGAQMLFPVALAQAILDQLVRGRGIGDAQQCLGQAHQHHALVGGQVVLAQESVYAAGRHPLGAHRPHQLLSLCLYTPLALRRRASPAEAGHRGRSTRRRARAHPCARAARTPRRGGGGR